MLKIQKDLLVSPLPDPNGSLNKVVNSAAIEAAIEEVTAVLNAGKGSRLDKKHSMWTLVHQSVEIVF